MIYLETDSFVKSKLCLTDFSTNGGSKDSNEGVGVSNCLVAPHRPPRKSPVVKNNVTIAIPCQFCVRGRMGAVESNFDA